MAEDGRAGDATALDRITDMLGVIHAGAEHEPGTPVLAIRDDLVDRRLGDRILVDCGLELTGDELAAAAGNTRDVELGRGLLAGKGREVALIDQLAHRDLERDVVEQGIRADMQHAAVETVGRGGQADDLELRVDVGEIVEEAAVGGVGAPRNQMRLIHQHQVGALDGVGLLVDRLDPREQDLRLDIPPVQSSTVDPRRRLGPQADQLRKVLADQLADMGQDDDPLVRPMGQHLLDEGSHDERLAAGGGDHHQGMATLHREIGIDRVDGGALVWAEPQGHAAQSRQIAAVRLAVGDPRPVGIGVDLLALDQVGD